jgi:penicillin amidase
MASDKLTLSRPTALNTLKLIREKPELSFFDIEGSPAKETAPDVVRRAFQFGVEDIEDWIAAHSDTTKSSQSVVTPEWAAYKDSYLTHLLRLQPMNVHIVAGGGRDIVNAHSRTHGPSWRMVVSLEKPGVRAWGTYPGGQSGNPGGVHYTDMLGRWLDGKYFSLHFLRSTDDRHVVCTLDLNPASKDAPSE